LRVDDGVDVVTDVWQISLATLSEPAGRSGDAFRATDRFVGGPENALVRAAVQAFPESFDHPGRSVPRYNPMVLYGPSGTGKSFLARGMTAAWLQRRPADPRIATTGADFARAYATAVDVDDLDGFRQRHASARLFVLDDLGQLIGKHPAQGALVRILDLLLEQDAAVVVTSAQLPATTRQLLPALTSRLSSGLTVPLVPPGPATRYALFELLAEARQVTLTPAAARELADRLPTVVPRLLGIFLELEFLAGHRQSAISEPLVHAYLARLGAGRTVTLAAIKQHVARRFQLTVNELNGPSRRQTVVQARAAAMYLCRELTSASLLTIGRHFGGRDHTTVLHACRKMAAARDTTLRQVLHQLRTQLSSLETNARRPGRGKSVACASADVDSAAISGEP